MTITEARPARDVRSQSRPSARARARPGRRARPGVQLLALAMCLIGAGMLPWMAYLAMSLPASTRAYHWPEAWVVLDGLEAAGFLTTGTLLCHRDPRYCLSAIATAAFLVTDALFDVTTAAGPGLRVSIAMALLAELPGAGICTVIAIRALAPLSPRAAPHRAVRSRARISAVSRRGTHA